MTIANTGDEKLDCAYGYVCDVIDRVNEIIKDNM